MRPIIKTVLALFAAMVMLLLGIAVTGGVIVQTIADVAGCAVSLITTVPVAIGDVMGQFVKKDGQNTADLSPEQLKNAATIIGVGRSMNMSDWAIKIALAASLTESKLRNVIVAVDHDSLGLFQGRPSQGWGTPAQLTDTEYVSRDFFQRLQKVPDWENIELWRVADAILNPAEKYSRRYADWENFADAILKASTVISNGTIAVVGDSLTVGVEPYEQSDLLAQGWAHAVVDGAGSRRIAEGFDNKEPVSGIDAVKRVLANGVKPDAWIIALGTNDLASAGTVESAKALIVKLLDELGGSNVLWVNTFVPSRQAKVDNFNAALVQLTNERPELRVFDWASIATKNLEWLSSDGVHYGKTGYEQRSKLVAQASSVLRQTFSKEPKTNSSGGGSSSICDLPAKLLGGAFNIVIGQVGQVYRSVDFAIGVGVDAAKAAGGFFDWGFSKIGTSLVDVLGGSTDAGVTAVSSHTIAKEGDLIIWDPDPANPDAPPRRGMYVGDDKVIMEPAEGEVIAVTPIDWNGVAKVLRINVPGAVHSSGWVSPLKDAYRISSPFGMRLHPIKKVWSLHDGIDMAAPNGTKVYAAFDGKVTIKAIGPNVGPFIEITHPGGVMTRYVHLEAFADGIEVGKEVKAGDYLGYIGDCKCVDSTGTHLHFLVHVNFAPTDPVVFMSEKGVRL